MSSFRGAPVVLYFYPKDDTPGCTAQACGIRDVWGELERKGAVVLGVSPDSPRQARRSSGRSTSLPFTLLADEAHEVAEQYGTWVEKSMYGQDVHGHRALDVRDRRRRQRREGHAEGEARRPRGRRAGRLL